MRIDVMVDLAAHDAFNDIRNQVRMVSACYRDLTSWDEDSEKS